MKDICKCGKAKDTRAIQCRACKDSEPSEKACNGCGAVLLIEKYSLRPNGRGGYKRRSRCKECERQYAVKRLRSDPKKFYERKRQYEKKNPEKYLWSVRRRIWKRKGYDWKKIEEMFELSGGICQICKVKQLSKLKLCIDHCHVTGKLRGLLCSNCNHGLGKFRDNVELLKSAIEYLSK